MIRRIISALLILASLLLSSLTACSNSHADEEHRWPYTYHPYYNRFKDDVPAGNIKVSGRIYYFSAIMVRDKDENLDTAAGASLKKLYENIFVEFLDENTVKMIDYSNFFSMDAISGTREGNVLTVRNTNNTGTYSYDIRIEIHKDKVVFIHNGHTYDEPGKYATITFTAE